MNDSSGHNTYYTNPESAPEMVRLRKQDQLLTKYMGGLFPDSIDLSQIHDILDLACGPGGWVFDVAYTHPKKHVVGVDVSQTLIEYARAEAKVQWLGNVIFEVMNILQPLDFPDGSFDLVNARTIAGFMLTDTWPTLLQESMRILRPGGVLRLTETDRWGQTNSLAFEQLSSLCMMALFLSGHSFDKSGRTFGITPMLEHLLAQAGFQQIATSQYDIDFSAGTAAHESMYENLRVFFQLAQPFLLATRSTYPHAGIPDKQELDHLYEQVILDMLSDNFSATFSLLSAWGKKPRE
jgi:SAM-dependent methyltransferase